MPTPVFICGAECGLVTTGAASAGVEHWSGVGSPVAITTSHLFTSARAFRFNATGTATVLTHTFGTPIASPSSQATRFKFYFAGSLPSGSCHISRQQALTGAIQYNATTGKIGLGSVLGSPQVEGPVIAADTIYEVSYMVRRDNAIGTTWWLTVDGVDYGNVTSSGISNDGPNIIIGMVTNGVTADLRIDDLITSGTAADYPIPQGTVKGLYPASDGAHGGTWASGAFGKGAGGATAAARTDTNIWQSLQNPLSTTIPTNFVSDLTATVTTDYVQFVLNTLPASAASAVNGAMLVATTHSASTTANNFTLHNRSGTSLMSLDLSETTITVPVAMVANLADVLADIYAIRFTSTDSNPDVYLDGVCLEVDYVPVVVGGRPPSRREVVQAVNRGSFY